MELVFFCFCVQSRFSESFQHFFDVAPVLRDIVGVDEDVIQVDHYAHIQEVREHIIHEALEGNWSVS